MVRLASMFLMGIWCSGRLALGLAQSPSPTAGIASKTDPQGVAVRILQESPAPLPDAPDVSITGVSESEIQALDLETRRYLLYLYARVNKPRVAESLARRILSESPADRQTLLVLASLYIELKETEKALVTAKRLAHYYPKDDQAIYFLAAAHYQAGHFDQANAILRDLKSSQFKKRHYPYQTDLASAATGGEDWHRAMLAYQDLLRNHNLIQPLRLEARKVLEGIYRKHLPQLAADFESVIVESGTINRYSGDYKQHVTDSAVVGFFARVDDLSLKSAGQFRESSQVRHEAGIRIELRQSRRWSSVFSLGGADAGPLLGASISRSLGEQRSVTLEGYWNERATDGLLAEAIDSRHHRLSLKANYLFSRSWLAYGETLFRKIVIDGDSVATGWGANANVEYLIFHDKPELRVGYHAQWAASTSARAKLGLIDTAVDPSITIDERRLILSSLFLRQNNRQGTYFDLRHELSGALLWHTQGGIDYVFEQASIEWYATTGLSFFPRKSIELKSGIGYSTSANTTDFASDQWIVSGGLKWYF